MSPPDVQLQHPEFLLFLPVLLFLLWQLWRTESVFSGFYSLLLLFLSGGFFVLALAAPEIDVSSEKEHVLFLVDVSRSTGSDVDRIQDLLEEYRNRKSGNKRVYSLILFGKRPVSVFQRRSLKEERPGSDTLKDAIERADPSGTELLTVVKRALGIVTKKETARFVLASDGNFSYEHVYRAGSLLGDRQIPVHAIPVRKGFSRDVWIESVAHPSRVRPGETFEVRVTIRSRGSFQSTVLLQQNGEVINRRKNVRTRENQSATVRFVQDKERRPAAEFAVKVETDQTEWTKKNNKQQFTVGVTGQIQVLWLGSPERSRRLASVMDSDVYSIRHVREPVDVQPYDLLIVGKGAQNVSREWMREVHSSWSRGHLSTVMIGGKQAYASGGWGSTPIEKTLPVRVHPPDRLSVILLVDVSGSMKEEVKGGETKRRIDVARDAVSRSLRYLKAEDYVGLSTYAVESRTVIPLREYGEGSEIRNKLYGKPFRPGGGTHLAPALQKVLDQLNSAEGDRKYVFVFSDSQLDRDERSSLKELGQRAKDHQISIIAITARRDTSRSKLKTLVQQDSTNRFIPYRRYDELERILDREMKRIRHLVRKDEGTPKRTRNTPFLPDAGKMIPDHYGVYHRVTPKPVVDPPLQSKQGEALVAAWAPGKAKSIVFTPFLPEGIRKDRKSWLSLMARGFRWVKPQKPERDWNIRTEVSRKKLRVFVLPKQPPEEDTYIKGKLLRNGSGTGSEQRGTRTGKKQFQFEFDRPGAGIYEFRAAVYQNGEKKEEVTEPLRVSYSPEYLDVSINRDVLQSLVESTEGSYAESYRNPLPDVKSEHRKETRQKSLRELCLILGLVGMVLLIIPRIAGLLLAVVRS